MITLHFIHGFLGFSNDWDIFKDDFKKYNYQFHSISNYIPQMNVDEKTYINSWVLNFNSSIFKDHSNKQLNILIGYSLGGRLALHSLLENDKWNAAIIISANPGLTSESEKQARITNDNMWANRFLNEKWDVVMESWNAQGVFSNIQNSFCRDEKQFNKNEVANILTGFSLGKQDNLREKIKNLSIPILWIAGEKDTKFAKVAHEMKDLNNKIEIKIIHDAGHRVPWEKQEEFKQACLSFISAKF